MKMVKKVQKYADEFEKFSPVEQPVDIDEEDPEEDKGIHQPLKKSDMVYGKKLEYLQ